MLEEVGYETPVDRSVIMLVVEDLSGTEFFKFWVLREDELMDSLDNLE